MNIAETMHSLISLESSETSYIFTIIVMEAYNYINSQIVDGNCDSLTILFLMRLLV